MDNRVLVEKRPDIEDNIVVLDPHDSIDGYARTYGDQIAEWYEDHKLIAVPFWPLPGDMEFLQQVTMPEAFKKPGSDQGLDGPLFYRDGGKLVSKHPLLGLNLEWPAAVFLRDQIHEIYTQLRADLPKLFPRYRMREANITFRYTPTRDGGMHLDVFGKAGTEHRVKVFLNMDSEYRVWRTSHGLLQAMELYKDKLGDIPCDIDRNELNKIINARICPHVPFNLVRYPTLSCVIGNGETMMHEVTYGNRMIAMEYFAENDSMLNPDRYIGLALPRRMRELGYPATAAATAP